jgi:hypothetical protein
LEKHLRDRENKFTPSDLAAQGNEIMKEHLIRKKIKNILIFVVFSATLGVGFYTSFIGGSASIVAANYVCGFCFFYVWWLDDKVHQQRLNETSSLLSCAEGN